MDPRSGSPGADVAPLEEAGAGQLAAARRAAAGGRWREAASSLRALDQRSPLAAEDLELLATASFLRGDRETCRRARLRAYQLHLHDGDRRRAARCSAWLGLELLGAGELAEAAGCLPVTISACSAWAAQAEALLGEEACAERGHVLIADAYEQLTTGGDLERAARAAAEAVELGRRYDDPDVVALGMTVQGRALVRSGRAPEGLILLDGSVAVARGGEVVPSLVGLVLTSAIDAANEAFELLLGDEWTDALEQWCDQQEGLVTFRSRSLAFRAASHERRGRWDEALEVADRACEDTIAAVDPPAAALARYLQGEVLRRRGDREAAVAAYTGAGELGLDPQPGLALLQLLSGEAEAAAASIARGLGEADSMLERARLLPAHVEILLACGHVTAATAAATELDAIATRYATPALEATAQQTSGAVLLAEGEPLAALSRLRPALRVWRHLGMPFDEARTRLLVAACCRQLGDEATTSLELQTASRVLALLDASPDLDRARTLQRTETTGTSTHGLTGRELEVLRLVATGLTNREIADVLTVALRTVDTHVSSILTKLDVSTRAAATAFAHRHDLADTSYAEPPRRRPPEVR